MTISRIAMWSGPRNLSTALLRSFASRNDCTVVDEPFYAPYLSKSKVNHPMRDLILKEYENDPFKVAQDCINGPVCSKIQYQKHMTHHMLPEFDRRFILKLSNGFLIRSPEKVIKSFGKKIQHFDILELGFIQQAELFNLIVKEKDIIPPVIDADDLCVNPRGALISLCSNLNIPFVESMLKWTKGPHQYDGVWGSYWYQSVNASTSFLQPGILSETTTDFEKRMISKVYPYYLILRKHKLNF